jgi:MFS family permease
MTDTAGAHRAAHPIAFFVLYLPFGASSGFCNITLAFLLHQHGVSVPGVAGIVAMNYLPNTWKVLWAPVVDTTFTARIWYVIGVFACMTGFLIPGLISLGPAHLPLFAAVAFALGFASSIAAMAAERFMAFDTPEEQKGRAGGWSQAGNLGGGGLGGGLGLWLAVHTGMSWTAGAFLATMSALCILMAFRLRSPPRVAATKGVLGTISETIVDVFQMLTRRAGLLAVLVVLVPLGTGAASNLWSSIAGDWKAGADEVAFVAGTLNGIVAIIGSLGAGYVCDRMDRKAAYVLFGLISAVAAVAMALGPRTPMGFMIFVTAYNLVIGCCYGAFSALTLEAIGKGAAATKYNLLASASNTPILVMTLVLGQAQANWGSGGMLLTEAACAGIAAVFYTVVVFATRGWSWRGAGRLVGLRPAESG